jgi:hypothetical protein
MQSYRDLIVWQKAMNLVISTYQVTQIFLKAKSRDWQVRCNAPQSLFLPRLRKVMD